MLCLPNKKMVFFDVDDTLMTQTQPDDRPACDFIFNWKGQKIPIWICKKGVAKLKEKSAAGYGILVFSQQGAEWADQAVRALGLESIVHLSMAKPEVIYDDLPFDYWTKRVDPNK